MRILKQYVSLFSESYFNEFYKEIGDKIIYKEKGSSLIQVRNNKNYYLKWGTIYLAIGVALFLYVGRYSLTNLDFSIVFMLMLVSFPAFGLGLIFLYRSNSKSKMVFDLKSSNLHINNNSKVDFRYIKELNFTRLKGFRGPTSYHLNLIIRAEEFTIFKSENQEAIIDSGNYISEITGIKLIEKFEDA